MKTALSLVDFYSDPTPIATVEQFKTALKAVRDGIGISQNEIAMLKFHCRAPAHTITAQQLAEEFGYSHYVAANGQYGTLAHNVCDALHLVLPPTPSGDAMWWRALAYGADGDNYKWIMRPELVQVLQEWKWA